MNKRTPPRRALRFFRWFCNPDYVEDIEGDLLERFEKRIKEKKAARWLFILDVLQLFRPGLIKKFEGTQKLNYYGMIKNDFKTAFRIMKREKLYSGINILGLTSGLVIALLILFFVKFEMSYEDFNPHADKVVRITMDYLDGETLIDQDCETYHILGPMISKEFPEVVDFTRAFGLDEMLIKVGEEQFRESMVYAVDPSFLETFGYPLVSGDNSSALTQPNQAVLTESVALKYFGTKDAVGKSIYLVGPQINMEVVGIVKDSPANTHMKIGLIISYLSMEQFLSKREDVWDNNDTYTYLTLKDSKSYGLFKENLADLNKKLQVEIIPDERIISQPIKDIHLYSHKSYEVEQNGDATVVFFLLGVGLLVIVIAVVNYINLSTAKSLDRAKEVGIRKVIGSSLGQLRIRFFIESFLINLFAGVTSLIIISSLFEPFKRLAGLPISADILTDQTFWLLFISLLFLSMLLSGSFPAFILSSFKPVSVLKGKFSHSKRGIFLRKSLVIFQFSIAIFLMIQTLTATEQLEYMQKKDLGMSTEKIVVVYTPTRTDQKRGFGSFKDELLSHSQFQNVSLSTCVPGMPTSDMASTTNIHLEEDLIKRNNNFFIYQIDSNFISTMKMDLVQGENFTNRLNVENPFIVNEQALRLWGIAESENAIGKKSHFWGKENTLVGVVKNFHQIGVKSAHIPMIFLHRSQSGSYISIKLSEGDVIRQMDTMERIYNAHFPNRPFDFFFLDQKFDSQYKNDVQFQKVFTVLSTFAIIITCLGLFGLATYMVAKRTKEIGIRKVLGASVSSIISLLSKEFMVLVVLSALVAIPLTYFLIQGWLEQYAFRIELNVWLFLLPALLVLVVAYGTVFSRAFNVSQANPVEALRDE